MFEGVCAPLTALLLTLPGCSTSFAQPAITPDLPAYKRTAGISGTLSSIGSDTMNNLMTYWAEEFRKFYPHVAVEVEGKGSSTAPPALISQTAQLAPMSRLMKDSETDQFEGAYGYRPTMFRVAIDAIAIYVHLDNPLESISMQQIDAMFSRTRRGGSMQDIAFWGQLGLPGGWQRRFVSLYGRNSASGTYVYFKEHALCNGDFKSTVKELPGSSSVLQAVTLDRDGIGYAGIGYLTSGVRAVSLFLEGRNAPVPPTMHNVLSGEYPLSRSLYIYVNKKPGAPLDPLVREFLKFIFSRQGQEMVVKDGYLPLPFSVVRHQLEKVE